MIASPQQAPRWCRSMGEHKLLLNRGSDCSLSGLLEYFLRSKLDEVFDILSLSQRRS